ncbi:MAG: hypothetical protein JF886_03500 [Candidatus Dormibacteraeota bacterium]|uniref:Uncharacterized protein n=1 Tax=Candidatus Aeolococcus gillhamiae TaxID=3127015 RepID=A0A2W5ZDQ4_9BACT|nr:hypothetical protein [Candidatus Dormibacteraeota bacterium]PZR81085.1 MAG: hypothetical protein DLM65_06545 [Candidatus Dormibacter sp. RRmetagenome_bin12]
MLLLPLLVLVPLIVLLVLRSRKRRDAPAPAHQAPAIVYVAASAVAGAAVGFISLEAYYGIVLAAAAGFLLVRRAGRQRWFALGGFLFGVGACASAFLSAALTNHDPAVSFDPSTVPFFWVGAAVALCGVATIVLASTGPLRGRSG